MPQSLTKIWVHLIFSTNNRYPFLNEINIQQRTYNYIKKVCLDQQCELEAIGGVEDHVHLLINLNRKISLANLVETIKKSSSKWIKSIDQENNDLSQFYWQKGYGAFSVSESNINQVKLYIKNQQSHHQKLTFKEEIKRFLTQHHVAFNEKYLWD